MSGEDPIRGYVVGPRQGVPGSGSEVKASGRSTAGSLTAIEIVVAGQGPPRHTHTREDESIHLFTGALDVECGVDRFEAAKVQARYGIFRSGCEQNTHTERHLAKL